MTAKYNGILSNLWALVFASIGAGVLYQFKVYWLAVTNVRFEGILARTINFAAKSVVLI